MSVGVRDYTVLLATRHKLTHPALTPAEAGTGFTYMGSARILAMCR